MESQGINKTATKVINSWTTECGTCGYGSGGIYGSPALKDPPQTPLSPESTHCTGCGGEFTDTVRNY